jgi:hypothetical protein
MRTGLSWPLIAANRKQVVQVLTSLTTNVWKESHDRGLESWRH